MIKNSNLVAFVQGFPALGSLIGFDFVIELNRNLVLIQNEVELLDKIREASEKVKAYNKAGAEIYIKYSNKGADGSPIMIDLGGGKQRYDVDPTKSSSFKKDMDALDKVNKKDLDEQKVKDEEYLKALKAETKVKLYKFKQEDIPENISVIQMQILFSVGMVK